MLHKIHVNRQEPKQEIAQGVNSKYDDMDFFDRYINV